LSQFITFLSKFIYNAKIAKKQKFDMQNANKIIKNARICTPTKKPVSRV